jgi:ribosomal protein S18 acetylase RimI-like enzyme
MTLHIVRTDQRDADLIVDLGRRTYRAHFGSIWSPMDLERYLAGEFAPDTVAGDLAMGRVRYYVARLAEGPPLGYAKVRLDRPVPGGRVIASGPAMDGGDTGLELEKIYFEAWATGCGYGSALIEHVTAVARAERQPCVWLDVLKTNVGGRRVYERHGFQIVGERPFRTDLEEIGLWVMLRPL